MELVQSLNLNKHPKDCQNLSLISARGVKLANDQSCITNEETISNIEVIKDFLTNYYTNSNFNIIGIIPCNSEIVIIVNNNNAALSQIFRYIEKTKQISLAYDKYKYNGGKIKGTYTYNVENSLIISIAEDASSLNKKIPLKTINLGNINDSNIANDSLLSDDYISISPKVKIPFNGTPNYIKGSAYKGWYFMYIRYKINTVDYTQWYNFGYPIYVDELKPHQIIRYVYPQTLTINDPTGLLYTMDGFNDGYGVGCSDRFSDVTDISGTTFKTYISGLDNRYTQYQIGLVCSSKAYTKSFRTSDLNINTNIFVFDIKQLIEISVGELILDNYNYYNVGNITNYNNRLYITNYEEISSNNDNILNIEVSPGVNIIDNIDVKLRVENYTFYSLLVDTFTTSMFAHNRSLGQSTYQYETHILDWNGLPFSTFFNVDASTEFRIVGTDTGGTSRNLIAAAGDITVNVRDNVYPGYIEIRVLSTILYTFRGVVTYTNLSNDATGEIKTDWIAIGGEISYINNNNSFNFRKNQSTLLPGEVYNFFIHFVDEYGHATNGYKLTNKDKRTVAGNPNEIIPIKIDIDVSGYSNTEAYIAFDTDTTIGQINGYFNGKVYALIDSNGVLNGEITDPTLLQGCIDAFYAKYKSIITNSNFNDYKIYQIFNTGYIGSVNLFGKHTNNNGDLLFKIPNIKDDNFYSLEIQNVTIPNGYIGYFISHEKFEATKRVTGFLTRADFRTQSKIINGTTLIATHDTYNLNYSDKMFLYSSKFDIDDSIKLDYNMLTIIHKDAFQRREIQPYEYYQRNKFMKYPYDYNKVQNDRTYINNEIYAMPEYKLVVANSVKDDRVGVGTALQMTDSYNLFNTKELNIANNDENIVTYVAELSNISNNLYMSKNKTLIRISNVIYNSNNNYITNGYNGRITYDGVLIYNHDGFIFNEADFTARRIRNSVDKPYYKNTLIISESISEHSYTNNIPFANYLQFMVYDDYFYESKHFNNEPRGYMFPIKGLDTEDPNAKSFYPGAIVEPKNSIDLFKNRQGSVDMFHLKTYTNFRDDLVNVSRFDKSIRRSNVIQDETRHNAWRVFPIEGYKNIAENKGIITNIIGIGFYLLVHTEHSLFMFNRDATLKTQDRNVQLTQPDAFDIDYQEVFTSDKGYGGLQDSLSYVIDQFGYIFYNENLRHLFKFDNGKLDIIDEDFYLWLQKYKPYNVRFANDKYNNRLLIKCEFDIQVKSEDGLIITTEKNMEVFSYNYNTNKLISGHHYIFDKAYNTETELYILPHSDISIPNNIFSFKKGIEYGYVHESLIKPSDVNIVKTIGTKKYFNASIGIIVNINYEVIKFLEFIKYKLRKVDNEHIYDYNYKPVEKQSFPYSGDILKVYSEHCDTNELDISNTTVNEFNNYKKPYFELGSWNYNYFRNLIANHPTISAFDITRIYGNYIIIEFIFDNKDGELIEFEDIEVSITKQRLI